MMNELAALKLALDLGIAANHYLATQSQIGQIIGKASSEGRDLTDEELKQCVDIREKAFADRDAARRAAGFIP
jgi:hypothetical protein